MIKIISTSLCWIIFISMCIIGCFTLIKNQSQLNYISSEWDNIRERQQNGEQVSQEEINKLIRKHEQNVDKFRISK